MLSIKNGTFLNCSNVFLGQSLNAIKIKAKLNSWNLINLISFCSLMEAINKMKRQPTEWEEIFANKAANKGLISKVYKQLIQVNIKKRTTRQNRQQKI